MHEALIWIARAIARAHDHWRHTIGRRSPMSGKIAVIEEQLRRVRAENALLRGRWSRVPGRRRPHYRPHERMEVLWHAARYRLSIADTAAAFCITRQTITNWRRAMERRNPGLLPPLGTVRELVSELVLRLKAEWPDWGTRRIAGKLARMGIQASRSTVQRILGHPRPLQPEDRLLPRAVAGLLAKYPNHIWMIDFTRLGGVVRPTFVGAVIDAYSRKVLAIGLIKGEPKSRFATRLLRSAIARYGAPTWLVSDKDRALRNRLVNGLPRRFAIRRRYGAVGRKGSICLIERFWRSMKEEYVGHLFLYRHAHAIERPLRRYRAWFNEERAHQGLDQRTPDDVFFERPETPTRDLAGGTLHVRFHDGDRRLPILRVRDAA